MQRVLDVDAAPHRLFGTRKGDHVSVTLAFHHMSGPTLHESRNQFVVRADQPEPFEFEYAADSGEKMIVAAV